MCQHLQLTETQKRLLRDPGRPRAKFRMPSRLPKDDDLNFVLLVVLMGAVGIVTALAAIGIAFSAGPGSLPTEYFF